MNSKGVFIIIFILFFSFCKTKYKTSSLVYVKDGTLTECNVKTKLKAIDSKTINDYFFELTFIFKGSGDCGYFLNMHKNGTYEYESWNSWSGTRTLEKGNYTILKNKLYSQTNEKYERFSLNDYYIFHTQKQFDTQYERDEYYSGCIFENSNKYCLSKRKKLFVVDKIVKTKETKMN